MKNLFGIYHTFSSLQKNSLMATRDIHTLRITKIDGKSIFGKPRGCTHPTLVVRMKVIISPTPTEIKDLHTPLSFIVSFTIGQNVPCTIYISVNIIIQRLCSVELFREIHVRTIAPSNLPFSFYYLTLKTYRSNG